jgi:DNA-binding transcriptional regulator YdaS (Cro superfamily)
MPKKRLQENCTPELLDKMREAREILHAYFRGGVGRQKQTAQASGIFASLLSRMAHGESPITLEAAIMLEVATEGKLRAEVLCPVRSDVLQRFVSQRQNAEA